MAIDPHLLSASRAVEKSMEVKGGPFSLPKEKIQPLLNRNEVLRSVTFGDKMRRFMHGLRDKVPFLDSTDGKALREEVFTVYPFTDEAKELLTNKTRIQTAITDPALRLTRVRGGTSGMSETFVGHPPFNGRMLRTEKVSGSPRAKKSNIDIIDYKPDTTAHEILHAYFDQKHVPKNTFPLIEFSNAWNTEKRDNELLQFIDKHIGMHYEGIDSISRMHERFAYLGEILGRNGLKEIPKELQKFYSEVFK